jgi:uncharacterized surface protein with fasciclin (FAS1) repeats
MRVSQSAILGASLGAFLALTNVFSVASAADNKNIIDTASSAGNFTTLLKELQKAGLTETLKGKGPYTVFAPDDAAFNKMGSAALKDLENNKQKLSAVLLYHVVKGNWSAKTVAGVDKEQSLQGSYLSVHSTGGKTMLDDANVTKGDIKCSNGVIHEIDTVLMPQSQAE